MGIKFSNLASTTLASGVSSSTTSISVTSATSFPTLGSGDYFYASIGIGSASEVVKVTSISGTTFTAVRGQDSTTAISHSSGAEIALRVVAATLEDLRDATDNDTTYSAGTGVSLSGTTFSLTDTNSKLNLSGGTLTGNLNLGDNDKAVFGASDDLQIYHDGSNSFITDTGTGNLYVRASNELALTSAAGEAFFLGIADGSSYLYHNGSVKLNTTATGIDVTGSVTATGGNSGNWNTAYGWGNHASAGYLTSHQSLSGYATETYVGTQVSNLVDSSPSTLNTLNELAAALGDDPNFATTVSTSIGTKLPLAGGTLTGGLSGTTGSFSGSVTADKLSSQKLTSGNGGLRIHSSGTKIFAITEANAVNSGAMDLGASDAKFKDLHLSGTISSGAITSTELTITGGSGGADLYINNTSPTLGFTDSNSFSDASDIYIVRAGSTGDLQFQFFDDSANTTTTTFQIDETGNTTIAGTISSGAITSSGDLKLTASGAKIIVDAYTGSSQEGGGIFFREGFHSSNQYNLSIMARSRSNDGSPDGLSINGYEGVFFSTGSNSYQERFGIDVSGNISVGGTNIISQSRNLSNIGTISSGAITSTGLTVQSSTYNKISSYFSGTYTSGFKFSDMNGGIWYDAGTDDLTVSAGHANSQLILESGGSTSLTLASNNNATFAGTISSGAITAVGASGTSVVQNIRNPSTSWGQYALTRYGSEGANSRYMDFGYYRGASEATRGLVIKSQANATKFTFLDSGDFQIGTTTVIDASRNVITGSNFYFGATDSSLLAKDGANIRYLADGIHKFETYNGGWGERVRIDDAGLDVTGTISSGAISIDNGSQRVKYGVWSGTTYGVGMGTGYTYGAINNDYVMSFQMNDDSDRGFWWGDTGHGNDQGAMALSTDGYLTVASGLRLGFGESDTTHPSAGLQVNGTISSGAITAPSIRSSSGEFHVNRSSDGASAIRVDADGVVVIPSNYFYVPASQGSYFSSAVRFRGMISNDTGTDVTIGDTLNVTLGIKLNGTTVIDASRNLTNIGSITCGGINSTAATVLNSHSASDPDATSRSNYPAGQMLTHYSEANGVSIIGGQGGYAGSSLTIGEETGRSTAFKLIRGISDTNGTPAEEFSINGVGDAVFAGSVRAASGNYYGGSGVSVQYRGFGDKPIMTGVSGATYLYAGNSTTVALTLQSGRTVAPTLAIGSVNNFTDVIDASRNITAVNITPSGYISQATGQSHYFRGGTDGNWRIGSDITADTGGLITGPAIQLITGGSSTSYGFQIFGHQTPTLPVFEVIPNTTLASSITNVRGNFYINNTQVIDSSRNALFASTLQIGGSAIGAGNSYNVAGYKLLFGGGNSDSTSNYYIGTNLENVGGNYSKLDLRWHTGIRMGAQGVYGGIRFYNDEDLTSKLMSIGEGSSVTDVKVYNDLRVEGALYHSEWVRNHTNNSGHYWSQTGWHLYPKDVDDFYWRSGNSSSSALAMTCNSETVRGYFYVNSSSQIGMLNSGRGWSFKVDNSGNATATGNVTAYSDRRLKSDIEPLENSLNTVCQLQGIRYTRISTGVTEIGFVAQDVKKVVPELVDIVDSRTESSKGFSDGFEDLHVMKYQNTVALLVEAIKELKSEVDDLKNQLSQKEK